MWRAGSGLVLGVSEGQGESWAGGVGVGSEG